MSRVVYSFVEDMGMQYLVFDNKMDAMKKIAEHFKDTRKDCVIPYELFENDKLVIGYEDFEILKETSDFFKDNPIYKIAVTEHEARVHQKEFEL